VITGLDFSTLTFGEPLYLWLLAAPGVLLILWIVQVVRRRADTRRYTHERVVPVRERFTLAGDLAFWLSLILAASLCIVALARPQARVVIVRKAGADIVILQDGSASMRRFLTAVMFSTCCGVASAGIGRSRKEGRRG